MTLSDLLQKLPNATKTATGWQARCPAHEDTSPSLSIGEGREGILLHCFAGCTTEAVCAALGIEARELFFKSNGSQPARAVVATYDYTDESGKLLFQVLRFDPKDFRQRRPDMTSVDGWTWNTKGVQRVLFRLPEILGAVAEGRPVYLCEGEKDVLAMEAHGFTATCNPGGAGKWQDAYSETLRDADVVIIADRDAPGRQHAQTVAGKVQGVAWSVRVLELQDLDGKPVKDAADYFSAGGQAADLDALAEAAPVWTPAPIVDTAVADVAKSLLPPIDNATALLDDIGIILPPQIIEGVLHQGLKAVLGSSSKARKTWILLDVAVSVATGTPFWKWQTHKGKALYINFEIPRAFIRSRIKRLCEHKGIANADLSNLDIWTLRGHGTALWRLLPELLARIKSGEYLLIVIDPVYKALGGRDENSAGDIGELCNELERLAVATGSAVLYAAHFSKGNQSGKEAIDRIGGSGVFTRDADSIITLTRHQEEDSYTVDLILRNLPEQPPFVVSWKFPCMVPADDLDPARLKKPVGRTADHQPEDILKLLPETGLSHSDWREAASEDGISGSTFDRLLRSIRHQKPEVAIKEISSGRWKPILTPKNPNENGQVS